MPQITPYTFVMFGGTGDLARRKLVPALYNHFYEGKVSVPFSVIGISRKPMSQDEYRDFFAEDVKKYSRNEFNEELYEKMVASFYYISGDLNQDITYKTMEELLFHIESNTSDEYKNRLFYLAIAPDYFPVVIQNLTHFNIFKKGCSKPWHRIIIEKPFGSDLASARQLNKSLMELVDDSQLFRIDHYLGKEAVQNIFSLRFGNGIFEPIWNNHYVDHIQITASETLGVGGRGRYYEQSGAIRDMFQNHILQLVSLVTMEPPADMNPASLVIEKMKVIKSLRLSNGSSKALSASLIKGQYQGYVTEKDVDPHSNVETLLVAKLDLNNWRWAGVPIYIRTGKYLKQKKTEITVQFKKIPFSFFKDQQDVANRLIIGIEPKIGISVQFNIKHPDGINKIQPVRMDYCYECEFGKNTPEAYEKLLFDTLSGDSSMFASWPEIENSWKLVDSIISKVGDSIPYLYSMGSWGPDAAIEMIASDGRQWNDS